MLTIHILGGSLSLVAGAIALWVAKGSSLHRRSGRFFVYSMIVLALTGSALAAAEGNGISVIAGLLTFYLVVTGLTTVRRPSTRPRFLDVGATLFGLALSVGIIVYTAVQIDRGVSREGGVPTGILFKFGAVALLASIGDVRALRAPLPPVRRLTRHLWRLCFAFYASVASFFLGQMQVFPEAIRNPGLLALPVLLVVSAMAYWFWRVRIRGRLHGIEWS